MKAKIRERLGKNLLDSTTVPRYLDLTLPECYVPELGEQKQGKASETVYTVQVMQKANLVHESM